MADEADVAAQWQQMQIEEALSSRPRLDGHSAAVCDECGEPIPEARRDAIPGVRLCVSCQEAVERG